MTISAEKSLQPSACGAPQASQAARLLQAAPLSRREATARHWSPPAWRGVAGLPWLDVLVLGGLAPAVLLWFVPAQSLALALPVLVLVPLALGLFHGFFAGTSGALLALAAVAGIGYLKPGWMGEFPRAPAMGLLLVGMCAGEARDIWALRLRRLQGLSNYHQSRLAQFTSAYQLLKVSHSQLERRMAGTTNSLRTALERLESRTRQADPACTAPLGGLGPWLLDIMVEAGNLHTAAVYEVHGKGLLQLPCVAMVGQAADLSLFNPLLREALRSGAVTSVQAGHEAVHEHVIAVVPLVDASGQVHGIVSIYDMPFLGIHQDTFELLGMLGRHIGDILARRTRPAGQAQGPGSLRESLQCHLVDARHALPAALIACRVVDAAQREALVAHCCSSGRGLDQRWLCLNRQGQPVIIKLLPLTDEAGAQRYLARLQGGPGGAGVHAADGLVTYLWPLDKSRSAEEMLALLGELCDLPAPQAVSAPPVPPVPPAPLPAELAQ